MVYIYLFHVVKEKTSVSIFKREETFHGKSFRIHDVLAASDQGSYFEQEKSNALDKDEQS